MKKMISSEQCTRLVNTAMNISMAAVSIDITRMTETLLKLTDSCSDKANAEMEERYNKFNEVLGCTSALVTLLFTCLIAADLLRGCRKKCYWFPTKYFAFNGYSFVLMPVALKLACDNSAVLHHPVDQAARFANMAAIIIFLANGMPSLASKGKREFLSLIVGVGVLVLSDLYYFSHSVISHLVDRIAIGYVCLLFFQFLIILAYASKNTLCKRIYEMKYQSLSKRILNHEGPANRFSVSILKQEVESHWVMAEASDPQYVLSTDKLSLMSGLIVLICDAVTACIMKKVLAPKHSQHKDKVDMSSYGWSSWFILVASLVLMFVGSIAPVFRMFHCKPSWKIEDYWTQGLLDWTNSPLPFNLRDRKWRRRVYKSRIVLVKILVFFLLLILYVAEGFAIILGTILKLIKDQFKKNTGGNEELDVNVLLVQSQFSIDRKRVTCDLYYIRGLIEKSENRQENSFIEFLRQSNSFEGVRYLDTVPDGLRLSNVEIGWSLAVITLTSIAIALPNVNERRTDLLLGNVNYGLEYTKIVEKCFTRGEGDTNIQKIGSQLWTEVENSCTWLGLPLEKTHHQGKTPSQILQWFSDEALEIMREYSGHSDGDHNELLPHKQVVAILMYRLLNTLILLCEHRNITHDELFSVLVLKIADILVACCTNIEQVIRKNLYDGTSEEHTHNLNVAAKLLGRSVNILQVVSERDVPPLNANEMAFIVNWRSFLNRA